MRRVRQTSPGLSPAVFSRMSAAVAVSAALHVFLIYGFSLPPDSGAGARVTVIQARVSRRQPGAGPQQAKTPGRDGVPDSSPATPVVLSAPIPDVVEELVTATTPATAANDPEPSAAEGGVATRSNIPDPVHYAAKDLDVYPQAIKPITPAYPEAAHESEVAGFVTLQVSIDEVGRIVDISVIDAAPDGVFEQAALQALASAAFYPARKDGRSVRSRILIKVEFDPAADAAQ